MSSLDANLLISTASRNSPHPQVATQVPQLLPQRGGPDCLCSHLLPALCDSRSHPGSGTLPWRSRAVRAACRATPWPLLALLLSPQLLTRKCPPFPNGSPNVTSLGRHFSAHFLLTPPSCLPEATFLPSLCSQPPGWAPTVPAAPAPPFLEQLRVLQSLRRKSGLPTAEVRL